MWESAIITVLIPSISLVHQRQKDFYVILICDCQQGQCVCQNVPCYSGRHSCLLVLDWDQAFCNVSSLVKSYICSSLHVPIHPHASDWAVLTCGFLWLGLMANTFRDILRTPLYFSFCSPFQLPTVSLVADFNLFDNGVWSSDACSGYQLPVCMMAVYLNSFELYIVSWCHITRNTV